VKAGDMLYISEDITLHNHRCEKLRSYKEFDGTREMKEDNKKKRVQK
jgi:hypothetical protein